MAGIANKLNLLKPLVIDPTKCTTDKSLYQQILNTANERLKHQDKQWFDLGNAQTFNDPITAAEYLLEREYGDSSLFDQTQHTSVFIPPTFVSSQYIEKLLPS